MITFTGALAMIVALVYIASLPGLTSDAQGPRYYGGGWYCLTVCLPCGWP